MLRNVFGEPIPLTSDEIVEVVNQIGNPVECRVNAPSAEEADGLFDGWTADLLAEDGRRITTGGFENVDELCGALVEAGVDQFWID